ncbi:MAG: flagellar hook capping protein [Frankiales bacterium]|nr:flagellar hook capping protein [Frankiales bacterium]
MTTPLGTTGTSSTAATTTTRTASKAGDSAMGPDAFMKLLVAQLKYQNPMAPTDGQQYMTQMATFTQVEKLDSLVKAQAEVVQWQQRVSAEGLVGRGVTGTSDGATRSGTVVGVRYAEGSTLLELADGSALAPDAVTRVQSAAAPQATVPAAAPSSTTSTSTPSTSTASTASTTASPAGTPSA